MENPTVKHMARKAAHEEAGLAGVFTNPQLIAAADAASKVWQRDYCELAILLSDKTIAPQKRIDSAIAWINGELGEFEDD